MLCIGDLPLHNTFNDAQILASDPKLLNLIICINRDTHLYGCISKSFITLSEIALNEYTLIAKNSYI